MSILTVRTDGSCMPNPGNMGIGVIIHKEDGMIEKAVSQFIGYGTNNIAEYTAFIRGLEEVKKIKRPEDQVKIFVDSLLVYKQTKGEWKVKKQELKPLCERGKELIEEIENIEVICIGREGNGKADRLAREAIELKRITEREERKGMKKMKNLTNEVKDKTFKDYEKKNR